MKNKIIKIYYLVFISLIFLFFSSCTKEDEESLRIAIEKQEIEDYLRDKGKSITPTSSGLYFEQIEDGQGNSPLLDDFVLISFRETTLDGRVLDTSNKVEADSNKIITSSSIDGPLKLYMKGIRIKGLIEGLLLMKEGEKAWMLMPSSLTFNDYLPRIFEVELIKVIRDPIVYEKEKISNFLDTVYKQNSVTIRPTLSDTTSDGIYYIETLTGTGNYPITGDNVTVSFYGKLVEGQLIDIGPSNYSFTVDNNNTIPGLSAGVKKMKKGGKAIFVIPYNKAFGADGIIENNIIIIPMYATLVYYIELKSISSQ